MKEELAVPTFWATFAVILLVIIFYNTLGLRTEKTAETKQAEEEPASQKFWMAFAILLLVAAVSIALVIHV